MSFPGKLNWRDDFGMIYMMGTGKIGTEGNEVHEGERRGVERERVPTRAYGI